MVPYVEIPPLVIGPIRLHAFGILVGMGVVAGSLIAIRRARDYGLGYRLARTSMLWVLIVGFVAAHLVALIPHLERVFSDPWLLLRIPRGISSFGGFFGAVLGLFIFCRLYKQSFARFADTLILGFLVGWIFGRLGCSLIHDHPGWHSDFFLAVAYPDGSRHDLGFYELLFTVVLFVIFEFVRRRPLAPGRIALFIGLSYAPVRFLLDFLRAFDVRYYNLTLAQYACIALFFACLLLILRRTSSSDPLA
jgi:phosphatidylglycerol---prolipoprotein diacylglyceryl transferase